MSHGCYPERFVTGQCKKYHGEVWPHRGITESPWGKARTRQSSSLQCANESYAKARHSYRMSRDFGISVNTECVRAKRAREPEAVSRRSRETQAGSAERTAHGYLSGGSQPERAGFWKDGRQLLPPTCLAIRPDQGFEGYHLHDPSGALDFPCKFNSENARSISY